MQLNWYAILAVTLLEAFFVSAIFTALARRLALRWKILDAPGERKIHETPTPLLGGVSIYLSFTVVIIVNYLLLLSAGDLGVEWIETHVQTFLGDPSTRLLAAVFIGSLAVVTLGVMDDLNTLTPERKLAGQIFIGLLTVMAGIRLDFFIENFIQAIPVLEILPEGTRNVLSLGLSAALTIFWIVLMMNAMNFMDNMDGLCAGISIIAAASFFLCLLPRQEYFVCALLVVFAGSVAGFLVHNRNPAKIFMGDAGSMFCGYILSTVAVLGTFYTAEGSSRIAVAAPLLALCVPLFDISSVIVIRWRHGESIMKGDKRHFSHRLVELGMSQGQAVGFICLLAAIAGLGSALLSQVGTSGTLVLIGQTVGVFLLIVLMMRVGRNRNGDLR